MASAGVPAHVTVLFPFLPAESITANVLAELDVLFSRVEPLTACWTKLRSFPDGTWYLAADEETMLARLTRRVWNRWPEAPPYAGAFEDIVPHVTVAQGVSAEDAALVRRRVEEGLPVDTRIERVHLLVESDGGWTTTARFRLGQSPS